MLVATRLAALGDQSPIWWISPAWQADQLHADGVAQFISPGRLMLLRPKRAEDVLWCLEEILRSGTAGLAVADIPGLPGLTAVRRLHLAAETGAGLGKLAPIGLILTPGPGGAQGVESRWYMASDHPSEGGEGTEFQPDKAHFAQAHGGPARWLRERRRARMDPPRNWRVYLRAPQTSAPQDTFRSAHNGRMGFGLRPDGPRDPAAAVAVADTAH
jgi:protein ImuA